jgi:exosortase E/protease (VPEID-CTERM system)
VAAVLSIALAGLAFVPPRIIVTIARAMGHVWVHASMGGAATGGFVLLLVSFWDGLAPNPLELLAFRSVKACLGLFLDGVSVDPAGMRIATSNFGVRIRGGCSGAEGLCLMLVFSAAWLWFFRRESRFPRALLLVPLALAAVWMANVGRITALILIGHAGARQVALGGFHSQAGWILFNAIALGFAAASSRLPWLSREVEPPPTGVASTNATATYLGPFLAILAASFVSKGVSGTFEWLYPLRFVAPLLALWFFRADYRGLNWRFGWPAVWAGVGVFVAWIGMDLWSQTGAGGPLGAELQSLSPAARLGWITVRAAAAISTVPIAEELAFRGYLARRLVALDFESVSFRALMPTSIVVSSVLFGLLHGSHWLAGTLAGAVYALVARRGNRFGEAVAAHATTNALLAAWVIARGDWGLW